MSRVAGCGRGGVPRSIGHSGPPGFRAGTALLCARSRPWPLQAQAVRQLRGDFGGEGRTRGKSWIGIAASHSSEIKVSTNKGRVPSRSYTYSPVTFVAERKRDVRRSHPDTFPTLSGLQRERTDSRSHVASLEVRDGTENVVTIGRHLAPAIRRLESQERAGHTSSLRATERVYGINASRQTHPPGCRLI